MSREEREERIRFAGLEKRLRRESIVNRIEALYEELRGVDSGAFEVSGWRQATGQDRGGTTPQTLVPAHVSTLSSIADPS